MKKRDYEKQKAQLQESLETVQIIESEIWRLARISDDAAKAGMEHLGLVWPDDANLIHDAEYDIEQEMERLERNWITRNWTYSDWQTHALVAQNID